MLIGQTVGGPPTSYNWTRNGTIITSDNSFNISISVDGNSEAAYQQSLYRSTLTVIGRQAGLYQYSVSNRATPTVLTSNITIQGNTTEPLASKVTGLTLGCYGQ